MLENPAKRSNWIPYILLIVLVVVSLPTSPLFQHFGYDREIYRYIGMMITKGYLPYRDVFDHKPPGFYFIAAIAHLIGHWGFWVVSIVLTYITSLVILKFVRKRFSSFAFTLIVPLVFIFLSRYEPIYEGSGMIREFTQMYVALILFLRLRNQQLRFFIIGLLYALVFFTQQNEVLAVTVMGAYFILWDDEEKRFKKFPVLFKHGLFFIAGASAICVVLAGYLYFNNIFDDFVEQAFLFNMNFYVQESYSSALSDTSMLFYNLFPNFTIFAIAYIFLAKKSKYFLEYMVLFTALFVQLCASSMGYHFAHYFLSFIPYFCYLLYYALTQFKEKVGNEYRHIVAVAVFFLFIMPMPMILRYDAIFSHMYWSYKVQQSECYDKIKDIKGQDGQLFVFNGPPYLAMNCDLNTVSQSKLLYFHFYSNPKFDEGNKMFNETIQTLKKNKCKYIIDFSGYKPIAREELQRYWEQFMNTDYHVIYEHIGNYRVLQVNDR